jgi:hypothetical protein
MSMSGDEGKKRRPTAGDPRIRTLLFLVVGALLLYATFNHGPSGPKVNDRIDAAIEQDQASFRPNPEAVTTEEQADIATKLHPSVTIASTIALNVSDISAPGAYNCDVGYSVTDDSAIDIGNLQFSVSYTSPQGQGSTVESVRVPAFSTQGITPVTAFRGRCGGVTGHLTIHRCRFANGTDCSHLTEVVDQGAIALLRAQ